MANEETKNEVEEGIQVVAFKLLNEEYGVSILNVQEIRNLTDITRVPFAADYIKGVINLRGSVLPVIDLKKRLGLADGGPGHQQQAGGPEEGNQRQGNHPLPERDRQCGRQAHHYAESAGNPGSAERQQIILT